MFLYSFIKLFSEEETGIRAYKSKYSIPIRNNKKIYIP